MSRARPGCHSKVKAWHMKPERNALMLVRTNLLPIMGLGVLLSLFGGCERQQPAQREQQPERQEPAQPEQQTEQSGRQELQPREQIVGQSKSLPLPIEQSAAARHALLAWFEGEECTANELERVVGYGEAVVPNLAATLHGGLSPSKREEVRQHLQETYQALAAYAKEHKDSSLPKDASLQISEKDYVDTYLDNAEALYRLRAATALGRIGTPAARQALERSLELEKLRPDVRRVIE